MKNEIKRGDRVVFKPEWRSAEDTYFIALEDEFDGKVMVEAQVDLFIKPVQTVASRMLEPKSE